MDRRAFLKTIAASLAAMPLIPVPVFIPPRRPFVKMNRGGLLGLVSHLGVLPTTRELNICSGRVLKIDRWDGTGYPCFVENVCTFGSGPRPSAWIYDFDLWNFRDDDHLGPLHRLSEFNGFNNHHSFYASRRFGKHWTEVVTQGGGWLRNHLPAKRETYHGPS